MIRVKLLPWLWAQVEYDLCSMIFTLLCPMKLTDLQVYNEEDFLYQGHCYLPCLNENFLGSTSKSSSCQIALQSQGMGKQFLFSQSKAWGDTKKSHSKVTFPLFSTCSPLYCVFYATVHQNSVYAETVRFIKRKKCSFLCLIMCIFSYMFEDTLMYKGLKEESLTWEVPLRTWSTSDRF